MTHRARTTVFDLPLEGAVTIGRSQSCDIFLDDGQVSRKHATIHVTPTEVAIEDLGSHNGTVLVGATVQSDETQTGGAAEMRLVPHRRVVLQAEALIQIGTALITLTVNERRRLQSQPGIPGFIVEDGAMKRVLELADRAAPTQMTVLLLGESGSGKEMLARYVHQRSPRAANRMVSLNCGALPENLLESELFGHEKGAFTGATGAKPGLFEAAHGGTLFLDEVGELPPALQVKLLRVLEDRAVMRVGALEPRTVDVRFIAATNRDLEERVKAGHFREDLFYRLYGIALYLPALRERRDDILPLAERFLAELATGDGPPPALTQAAKDKLVAYSWPGNVRQLKNVIHRALVLAQGPRIDAADLELRERESRPTLPAVDPKTAPAPRFEAVTLDEPEELRQRAEEAERRKILDALEQCAGNQTRAAEVLGITRRVLVRKLEKFNLPRPRRDLRTPDPDTESD